MQLFLIDLVLILVLFHSIALLVLVFVVFCHPVVCQLIVDCILGCCRLPSFTWYILYNYVLLIFNQT